MLSLSRIPASGYITYCRHYESAYLI